MRRLLSLSFLLTVLTLVACSVFHDDFDDGECFDDTDCFRAQGEVCNAEGRCEVPPPMDSTVMDSTVDTSTDSSSDASDDSSSDSSSDAASDGSTDA